MIFNPFHLKKNKYKLKENIQNPRIERTLLPHTRFRPLPLLDILFGPQHPAVAAPLAFSSSSCSFTKGRLPSPFGNRFLAKVGLRIPLKHPKKQVIYAGEHHAFLSLFSVENMTCSCISERVGRDVFHVLTQLKTRMS